MERAKIDKSEAVKTELASDLKQTLASDFLSVEEKPVYHLILIKTEIDLKQNNEALSAAEQFLASYAYHPSAGEAHLLAAYAAEKIPGADDRFIEHAELALQMDAPMKDASDLRLRLFNTYLKREEWQPGRKRKRITSGVSQSGR